MNNEKETIKAGVDDELTLELLDRIYPYAKFSISYFHEIYGKASRNASWKRSSIYHMLYFFGKHLEKNKVPMPSKADLLDFLVENQPSVFDMKNGVPAICDFIDYCESHKNTLFNGAFKGWSIERIVIMRNESIIKQYYNSAKQENPSKGFYSKIYMDGEYCPEIERFNHEFDQGIKK